MRFRFTLTHEATSLEINEPDGWKQAIMKIARDKEFYSLIEFFDGSFIFYGDNGVINGGIHFIKALEQTYGPDVSIQILIELAPDDETYEEVFSGQLDLSLAEEMPMNKLRVPIIRDNFWAKFNTRWQTPVDLLADVDLDGNPVASPVDTVDTTLLSQTIQKKYVGEIADQVTANIWIPNADWTIGDYVQIDMDTEIISEIKEKYHIPTAKNPEIPVGIFFMEEGGSFEFDIRIEASATNNLGENYSLIGYLVMYIKIGNDAPIAFTETDYGPALGESTVFTYADTVNINASSNVIIYGEMIADISVHGGSTFFMIWPSGFATTPSGAGNSEGTLRATHLYVTGQTIFPENIASSFLLHDAAAAILKSYGLGEDNPFYSELLGSTLTNARTYDQDGCAWKYIVMKGLQVRGYTITEKPFFMSFEQWWKGINPILCLGLTYEETAASEIIVSNTDIDLVKDWDDAGGPEPGSWDYASFNYPAISINGNGGPSGYTCGLCATVAGETYEFTTLIQLFSPFTNPLDLTVTWAILDAGFNEVVIQSFNYSTYDEHLENFTLAPLANGVYLAVKAVNDTLFDTKTIHVRYAVSGFAEQILLNPDFDSLADWSQSGGGTAWGISSGALFVALASGSTQTIEQSFIGTIAGTYLLLSERTLSNVDVGPDSLNLGITLYDALDNVLGGTSDFGTANNTLPMWAEFTTVVPVAKIKIIASINSGSDIDISIPFAMLFAPIGISDIIVPESKFIRVEEREYFYDEEISVNISNIENIVRKYDNEKIYNKIEIGYSQWQSEDISGIDDPQTKSTYSTRFEKIGQGITVHSDFIAASLAIETTRRQTIEKSKDYKFDNNVFIIAINPDDISPDAYLPELDENFTSILNLLNSDTRYNIRLSVARNFLRWQKWFNGCLQQYLTSFFKFVGGEGNFDLITSMVDTSPDCLNEDYDGQPLSQKQDIQVTNDIVHTPNYYELEVPMEWETYKTIRNNRRNAIGISLTEQDFKALFIDILDYEPMNGKAKILGWTKEYFPLEVIEGPAATQDCTLPVDECLNAITDELNEILTDENGVCITE